MKVDYSERAGRTLDGLTPQLRKAVYKQVKLLEENLRHPSLRGKKYDESRNIWQARVNKDWRFNPRRCLLHYRHYPSPQVIPSK